MSNTVSEFEDKVDAKEATSEDILKLIDQFPELLDQTDILSAAFSDMSMSGVINDASALEAILERISQLELLKLLGDNGITDQNVIQGLARGLTFTSSTQDSAWANMANLSTVGMDAESWKQLQDAYNQGNYSLVDRVAFVASVLDFDINFDKKIAMSGNPYLFDEKFGLSKEVQNILCGITEENADDFAKNYLIKTDEEWKNFHSSKRSIVSCMSEFETIKKLYGENKHKIKDIYNMACIGEDDTIFDVSSQKEFYKERMTIIKNARHNLFYRINNYGQIFELQKENWKISSDRGYCKK